MIEFNDGALDLPRVKAAPVETTPPAPPAANGTVSPESLPNESKTPEPASETSSGTSVAEEKDSATPETPVAESVPSATEDNPPSVATENLSPATPAPEGLAGA